MKSPFPLAVLTLVALFVLGDSTIGQTRRGVRGRGTTAAASYEKNLLSSSTNLKKRAFDVALGFANKAIAQKPSDQRGYMHAIQAHVGLGDFISALSVGEQARLACPPETRQPLEDLLIQVVKDKEQSDRIRAAEKYASDGNAPMAAGAYVEAWNGDPANEELALRAASIFNDQVKDFDRSKTILDKLLLRTKDPAMSSQAKELLQIVENNRTEKAETDRRAAEERTAREAAERERQRELEKERQREAERRQVEEQIKELERERSRLESEVSSEESFADQQDGFAEDWERQANQYDSQPPLGPTFAVIARNKAKSARSKANSHRSNAKDAQRRIAGIDRQITSLEWKLY